MFYPREKQGRVMLIAQLYTRPCLGVCDILPWNPRKYPCGCDCL